MGWLDGFRSIGSGLQAQRIRMEVIAQNLANADVTRTPEGGPYRRQQVILTSSARPLIALPPFIRFATFLRELLADSSSATVQVAAIRPDTSPPRRVYDPGHPDAGPDGYVLFPNVDVPLEIVDLMTASRAYEANAMALQTLRRSLEHALELLR